MYIYYDADLSILEVRCVWVRGGGAQLEHRMARVTSALVTGGSSLATEPLLKQRDIVKLCHKNPYYVYYPNRVLISAKTQLVPGPWAA